MANKILTRAEVIEVIGGGQGSSDLNRCCTIAYAKQLGAASWAENDSNENRLIHSVTAPAKSTRQFLVIELSGNNTTPEAWRSSIYVAIVIQTSDTESKSYSWNYNAVDKAFIKHEITGCEYVHITVNGSTNDDWIPNSSTFKLAFVDENDTFITDFDTFTGRDYSGTLGTSTGVAFPLAGPFTGESRYAYLKHDSDNMTNGDYPGYWGSFHNASNGGFTDISTLHLSNGDKNIELHWNIYEYVWSIDPVADIPISVSGNAPDIQPTFSSSGDSNGVTINIMSELDNVSYPIGTALCVGGSTKEHSWNASSMYANGNARIDSLQILFTRPTTCYSLTAQLSIGRETVHINYGPDEKSESKTVWEFPFNEDYVIVPRGSSSLSVYVSKLTFIE